MLGRTQACCLLSAITALAFGPGGLASAMAATQPPRVSAGGPIKHIVVIDQENHSFDNVFGYLCVKTARCDGALSGLLPDGTTIALKRATDLVPNLGHAPRDQLAAIDGGKMDGFANVSLCGASNGYPCYTAFVPSQIPILSKLAFGFSISDRTFELGPVESWASHLELVSATSDGFVGKNPVTGTAGTGKPGWGCDSFTDARWVSPFNNYLTVPSCVPKADGTGPYKPSPVPYVPTIMERLDQAGISWKIYAGIPGIGGVYDDYGAAVCPTFASCIYSTEATHMDAAASIISDASAGNLPSVSIVAPTVVNSQHNFYSMAAGDNWIGAVVKAIYASPAWSSTVILITYDDCGCFYDHVQPPPGLGIREPMVIVGGLVKNSYTDSNVASPASALALIEHAFGLASLGGADATAYDYANSFNFAQVPRTLPALVPTPATDISIPTQAPDPTDTT